MKIDNVVQARPHEGVSAADIVYAEQVEGGLSRLLAVYSSRLPPRVGPVRSARESDLELLRQFGRPVLAYSGAQAAVSDMVRKSPVLSLPYADAEFAYARDGSRDA
ncbi:DUF3048 domain-containing protein, partial [Kitasatospora sp. NPDC058243]|uniref:DUF3048 N-terminal domain-containing protein n=1 Tax=Kitasatospora sp. NPDC058243 TaxID=3346397 RepID=UPI0036D780E1